MKLPTAVTALSSGLGRTARNSNGRRRRRADQARGVANGGMDGTVWICEDASWGGKEAESTHHLLRRYRRRLFLILPGPIWDALLRHCYYCAVVVVEGSGQAGPGAGGRGLGWKMQ
jgi:hypothetical protein